MPSDSPNGCRRYQRVINATVLIVTMEKVNEGLV